MQGAPVGNGALPGIALGCKVAATQVIDGGVIDGDKAHACAGLDRHVAERHAPFHGQGADSAPGKFDGMARTARRTDASDNRQRDVLGTDALAQTPFDADQHGFRFLLQQALRRHDVFDFGRADTQRHAAESAVRTGMRIAANDGHAGQGRAVFRADDMDDALTLVLERVIGQRTGFTDVGVEGFHLQTRDRVFDATLPMIGRRVVIGC